ncbi:hypothetical protein SG34_013765 [Thalassomonas viridans]|uniref:Uncharacterized protein n=1 Tax=Thalassomonas viridans TaxID=137584 RepID=A0AAE9Z867_9GAMM|nr:hypothetical protein [Thalassomonas viridans]WDE07850.1 hypothetical protein SG34_013765 [Thalassomonas viridans]
MNTRTVILGTIAYTVVTFPLAVIWHVVLFEEQFRAFGYFDGEPNFALGFLTILIQGFMLSFLFPLFKLSGQALSRGLKYALLMGVFFWTSHVLALVAKQEMNGALSFVVMESFYLVIQFGIFGILIGFIHGKTQNKP